MSETATATIETPALGVGTIFTQTFGIYFRRIGWMFLFALGPALAVEAIDVGLASTFFFQAGAEDFFVSMMIYFGLSLLVSSIGSALAAAIIARAVYDVKLGRRIRPGACFGAMLRCFVPLVVAAVGLGIASALGMAALIVPGLWLTGLWIAVFPAMVVEREGLGAIGRSQQLTRGYRWPAAGAMLLIWLMVWLVRGAVEVPILFAFGTFGLETMAENYQIVSVVLYTLVGTVQLGLTAIAATLIYARLREIKEGQPVETLAEVFD